MTKVMIVDDSEITLEVTEAALASAGYEVFALKSPLGLTAALYQRLPDLLLIDVDMPALSGSKVAQLVKSNKRFASLKVILYSSRSSEELEAAVNDSGSDGYVQKTGDASDLVRSLKRLLTA
jgi:CheY-like chemotaxis protein